MKKGMSAKKLTKKSAIAYLLILFFMTNPVFHPVSASEAEAETIVKVEPQECFAKINQTFSINITILNVENLYGLDILLAWNYSILEAINVSHYLGVEDYPYGVLHKNLTIYKIEVCQEKGTFKLVASSISPALPFNGNGTLATITFRVIGFGNSDLTIRAELASNIQTPEGVKPINHIEVNGRYYPIRISVTPKAADLGQNINISGDLAIAQENLEVKLLTRKHGSQTWVTETASQTDEKGTFLITWKPKTGGKYYVKAIVTNSIKGESQTIPVEIHEFTIRPYAISLIILIAIIVIIAIFIIEKKLKRR